jgi:phospholipase/lecithinase/hemolysin
MAVTALCLIAASCGGVQAGEITGIVAFGDSLSDTGNVFAATGGTQPAPPSDYYQGRFTNGPNWVEYLAKDLGLAPPTPSVSGGTDYAWGGAQTGMGTTLLGGLLPVPNIGTQISDYLGSHTPSATQLFTIWGGGNDVLLGSQPNPVTSVSNIAQDITTLAQAGARQFLVPNLPPLNEIPLASTLTPAQQAGIAQFSQAFDQLLPSELAQLQRSLGVQIHMLDVNNLFNAVTADPTKFGPTNVTGSALNSKLDGTGYLFWDAEHPTTSVDQLIGGLAAQSVPEPSSLVIFGALLGGAVISMRFGTTLGFNRGVASRGRALVPARPRRFDPRRRPGCA